MLFCQIGLDDETKKKTAFYVPGGGFYQFTRMPAGLKDAVVRWQGYIEKLLGYHPNAVIHIDEILHWSSEQDSEGHKNVTRS